jgi:hypothetical protein
VLGPLARQFAVLGVRGDVEVHVTAGRVRVSGVDQPSDQRDHLGNVPRCPRLDVRRQAAKDVVSAGESPLVALGHGPPRAAFFGGRSQDLVVDVGDVPAERDLQAAHPEPADEDVKADPGADVPDVRRCLNGRATQVQTGLARSDGKEVAHGARRGVVQAGVIRQLRI